MSEKPIREYDRFILRLPDGMREMLAQRAKLMGRSMNSEIIHCIKMMTDEAPEAEITTWLSELKNSQSLLDASLKVTGELFERRNHIVELLQRYAPGRLEQEMPELSHLVEPQDLKPD